MSDLYEVTTYDYDLGRYTPQVAAMLACILFEERKPRDFMYDAPPARQPGG